MRQDFFFFVSFMCIVICVNKIPSFLHLDLQFFNKTIELKNKKINSKDEIRLSKKIINMENFEHQHKHNTIRIIYVKMMSLCNSYV